MGTNGAGKKKLDLFQEIKWDKDRLVPAVIQDFEAKEVFTLCYLNEEALRRTLETGRVHVYRRSQGRLMQKGETSGHYQLVKEIRLDCEGNSLVIRVEQTGGACHQGYRSCYFRKVASDGSLVVGEERVFDPSLVYGKKKEEDK